MCQIREQNNFYLPTGITDHVFSFLENYGGSKDVFQASVNLLREEAEVSDVLQENQDFLEISLSKTARSYTRSGVTKAYRNHQRIFVFK